MQFERLDTHNYKKIKPFFDNQPYALSVFSLASVVPWRDEDGLAVHFAVEDDTLFLSAIHPAGQDEGYLGLPLPPNRFGPADLALLAKRLDFKRFDYIPGAYIDAHGLEPISAYFTVTENRKYFDYVYKTQDLVDLTGHRFSKKRNLIHQFEKMYLDAGRVRIAPIDPSNTPACIDFVKRFYEQQGRSHDSDDRRAAISTLTEFVGLDLTGIAVYVDKEICGIGTCARLTPKMGVLHLEMAFHDIKGLYQFLDRECARQLFLGRFEYINKESDMGLVGLRQAKRSYYPIARIPCYKLSLLDRSLHLTGLDSGSPFEKGGKGDF
ncbi:MAG: phosphatidylglycerol lysyltransferase domain-containing protein [Myxococcota bacterium]|nr:phosphatidylglycerol lysyltransferase domain-containing protein [Myxococcota bacterium]